MAGGELLKTVYGVSAVLAAAAVVAARGLTGGWPVPVGIATGWLIAVIPLASWQWASAGLRKGVGRGRKTLIVGVMALKYAGIAALLYVVLRNEWADPAAVAGGMTILVVSVLGTGFLGPRNDG